MSNRTFVHDGHCGDIIASLLTIRTLGGGKLIITNHKMAPQAWRPMKGEWRGIPSAYECIKPLLDIQPYISGVEWQDDPKEYTHDFRDFRRCYSNTRSLALAHARHLGVELTDYSPWIHVNNPYDFPQKTALFSRTQRHRNEVNPVNYANLVEAMTTCGYASSFVGVDIEWHEFCQTFGPIPFSPTSTLLEAANLIAGSSCFIGNPSVLMWIAMAMGIQIMQETEHVHGLSPVYDAIIPRPSLTVISGYNLIPGLDCLISEDYRDAKHL